MKKMILTGAVVLALADANLQTARADDREWATAGKVLTGMAVVGLVAAAIDGHAQGSVSYSCGTPPCCTPPPAVYCLPPAPPCNYQPAPPPPMVYCPPPVVVYRAPVVVYPSYQYAGHQEWHHRW